MAGFVSRPLSLASLRTGVRRLDVELHQVDQAVPSYEGRVFVDRPDADRHTPRTAAEGYLGSFFVFGKVYCWGEDEGHCATASDRRFDRRHPPGRHAKFRVTVSEAGLAHLRERARGDVTLSVVAVKPSGGGSGEGSDDEADPPSFGRMSLIAYA